MPSYDDYSPTGTMSRGARDIAGTKKKAKKQDDVYYDKMKPVPHLKTKKFQMPEYVKYDPIQKMGQQSKPHYERVLADPDAPEWAKKDAREQLAKMK